MESKLNTSGFFSEGGGLVIISEDNGTLNKDNVINDDVDYVDFEKWGIVIDNDDNNDVPIKSIQWGR